jgi:Concanavalin A-like lectin/glucanases superfamily/Immunoglobulin domain/Bacterial TSP3 repeat
MNPTPTKPNRWRPITVFNLLVGLLFSLSVLGQPAFLKEGLVAYYPFNGNANDESGKFNNGTIVHGSLAADRFNNMDAALRFKDDSIGVLTASLLINPRIFTLSAWVSIPSARAHNQDILVFAGDPINGPADRTLFIDTDGILKFYFGVREGLFTSSTKTILGDTWHHIVAVSSNGCRLYVDGVLVGSNPQMTDPAVFSGLWYIGNQVLGSADDVRIYNRALSTGEVSALYEYESTSPVQSPVFVSQPVSKTVNSGDNVVLSVVLQAAGTYNYQWQLNEQNIAGATTSSLSVNNAVAGSYRYRVIVSNSAGTIISDTATLTVSTPPAPSIATQPAPKTVQEGANVSFNVVATGQGSIVYQWQFNEQNLPGATSTTLNLNGVKLNTAGRYRVLISTQYGVTISDTVTLTVNPNPPPTIVTQPLSRTPAEGTQVSLTVTATGLGSLTYQWQINNQNIPGATSSTLVLSAVRPSANGNYRVIIGNPYGTTISTEATVTVVVTDSDSDDLSDYEELLLGTNATKADSDGDGLSDFAEVRTHGSNPLTTDTDGDGYSDGIEVARDGNPNNRSVTPTGALAVFPAVDVEFYTLNGVKYQLEVSTDMVVWTAQGGEVVGNGGSQNHLVRASKATQFWRLKVVQ